MNRYLIKYNFFLSLFSLIINKGKVSDKHYQFKLEEYIGLNNFGSCKLKIYWRQFREGSSLELLSNKK